MAPLVTPSWPSIAMISASIADSRGNPPPRVGAGGWKRQGFERPGPGSARPGGAYLTSFQWLFSTLIITIALAS